MKKKKLDIADDHISYKSGYSMIHIPFSDISKAEMVKQSSFRHPKMGWVFAGGAIVGSIIWILMSIRGETTLMAHIFDSPFAGMLFLAGCYFVWELRNSKDISWLKVVSSSHTHFIPLDELSDSDAKNLFEKVSAAERSNNQKSQTPI